MNLTWLGHASFRLECGQVVYFDPYKVALGKDADIVLVSHGHFDHLDQASIDSVGGGNAVILCPESCIEKVEGNVSALSPGESITVGGVRVEAHPAYNTNKSNHLIGDGVGWVVEAEGKRVYFAGDTDRIPEMRELGRVDVALLPVCGKYMMDWSEAADAVADIKPRIAVPMHYGSVIGTLSDAVKFKKKVDVGKTAEVRIIPRGESIEF